MSSDLASQASEALKYGAELREKGYVAEADEFESFLSNAVKKQATKAALGKLKQTNGEFSFDVKLKFSEISSLIEEIQTLIPPPRTLLNPFCMHKEDSRVCQFCRPSMNAIDPEIRDLERSMNLALEEKRKEFNELSKNY